MIMALYTLAFPGAGAETFQQLEKTLHAGPRARSETSTKFTNRMRAEQQERERLLPNALSDAVMGLLLLRGAGLAKTERDQVLIHMGCDYNVSQLVSVVKRVTDESSATVRSTPVKASYLAGLDEDEPLPSEKGEADDFTFDAMATLHGIEDDEAQDSQVQEGDGEILSEAEALDCLAAIGPPPPKPRARGEARGIVADRKIKMVFTPRRTAIISRSRSKRPRRGRSAARARKFDIRIESAQTTRSRRSGQQGDWRQWRC